MKETIVILHNIRSARNVGSVFRSADAFGVNKIYLTGYSPRPIDRFGREQKKIAKTALGAHKSVKWKGVEDIKKLIKKLKIEGFSIVAIEQNEKSINIEKFYFPKKVVFLFGNEIRGVSKQLIEKSDSVVEIPMYGHKESLNVSVAAGIILFTVSFKPNK